MSSQFLTNFPFLYSTVNWLTRSIHCLQVNSSARTLRKTLSSSFWWCVFIVPLPDKKTTYYIMRLLGAGRIENTASPIFFHVLKEGFTGRRTEMVFLILLPIFIAVRLFTDISLLLKKRPICHNTINNENRNLKLRRYVIRKSLDCFSKLREDTTEKLRSTLTNVILRTNGGTNDGFLRTR
jgi:hypothetical protein